MLSATTHGASLSQAVSLYEGDRIDESEMILLELARTSSADPEVWLQLGVVQIALGKADEARRSFATVSGKSIGPEPLKKLRAIRSQLISAATQSLYEEQLEDAARWSSVARALGGETRLDFLDAVVAWKQGRIEEARGLFRAIQADTQAPPSLREASGGFLARDPGLRLRLDAEAWLGASTNARAVGFSRGPVARGTRALGASVALSFLHAGPLSLAAEYGYAWEDIASFPQDRSQSHRVALPLALEWEQVGLTAAFRYEHQRLGSSALMSRLGADLDLRLGRSFGIFAEAYRFLGASPTYSYLSGGSVLVRPYASFALGRVRGSLGATALRERLGPVQGPGYLLPLSNSSYGPSVNLGAGLGSVWDLSVKASYLFRFYDERAWPLGERRVDDQTLVFLQVSRLLLPKTWGSLQLGYSRNRSTLQAVSVDDRNFNQWTLRFGLSWSRDS